MSQGTSPPTHLNWHPTIHPLSIHVHFHTIYLTLYLCKRLKYMDGIDERFVVGVNGGCDARRLYRLFCNACWISLSCLWANEHKELWNNRRMYRQTDRQTVMHSNAVFYLEQRMLTILSSYTGYFVGFPFPTFGSCFFNRHPFATGEDICGLLHSPVSLLTIICWTYLLGI